MLKENSIQLSNGVYVVCGHMASGKSTLLELFKELIPGSVVIDETPPTENPYFVEYCQAIGREGPNPFAFAVQKYFFEDAIGQGKKISEQAEDKVIFWGGSPWHHFMYVWLLYKDGSLSKEYYDEYCRLFVKYIPDLPMPKAGIVTLHETGESTHLSIEERANNSKGEKEKIARLAEVGIPIPYLDSQGDYWKARIEEGKLLPEKDEPRLKGLSPQIKILKLNTTKTDWRTYDKDGNLINDNDGIGRIILSKLATLAQ